MALHLLLADKLVHPRLCTNLMENFHLLRTRFEKEMAIWNLMKNNG